MIPFETALSAAFGFIARNWKLVLGGLVFTGLGIALVLAKADARHFKKLSDSRLQAWQMEQARHAVTRSSLDHAIAEIASQNAAVNRLHAEGEARTKAAASALEASRKAAERAEGIVAQLRASAGAKAAGEACRPSEALWINRGEL